MTIDTPRLIETAKAMMAAGKGMLAIDESTSTCDRRFAAAGIAQTVEMRRAYRELLVTAPGIGEFISGMILYDETIHQAASDGRPFVKILQASGIVPGIKVDLGAKDLAAHPGETVTEGLDGLRERLAAYAGLGARFAKWRGVIHIEGAGVPSQGGIDVNAHALARYAALCQEAGLVPVVEPEVLMDGDHSLARCAEVTQAVLQQVFAQLANQRVQLEGMVLKPNMVVAGLGCPVQPPVEEVADATVHCLLRSVPAAVAGIAFLSGGQPGEAASARLSAMHARFRPPARRELPWPLTFSFARAIQQPALELWAGRDENRAAAQRALVHRARCNGAALRGAYDPAMEAA
jgi:fructose-bisphosphate aldolase class I